MDFFEKMKGLLLEPSMTFDVLKEEPLEGAVKYYVGIATVYSAIFALMLGFASSFFGSMMGFGNLGMMLGAGAGIGAAITFFVVFITMAITGAFIGGAILHIFVYIAGGRKGITQTIKAEMYGSTASLLFGWLPIINIIALIWSLVTEIIGIRQLHDLTTGRAILALVLPMIIAFILIFVLASFLIIATTSTGIGPFQ